MIKRTIAYMIVITQINVIFCCEISGADWTEYVFDWVNIKINAPCGLYHIESNYDGPKVFMQLYPLDQKMDVIDDTFYRVKININRVSKKTLRLRKERYKKSHLYQISNPEQRKSRLWSFDIHEHFNCQRELQYYYCRKDILLENKELINGEVEIFDSVWGTQEERRKVLKDVEKIMNSMEKL